MPSLFARLRPAPPSSSVAYDAAVNVARQPHWYRAGAVPDTMDGRFAVLATVCALVALRLEADGEGGNAPGVALTEAFIADMDAQMRQEGFDATLGKKVRHLVGSLASRVDRWRGVTDANWNEVVRRSLYRDQPVADDTLAHSVDRLRGLRKKLAALTLDKVIEGHWA